ncbi:hypothetical protein EX30DRAFT_349426 [Ascodesmis nigricans]|uniref:Uncharacterized protein n=1 Tax=Ascodesmis nigricans TaxID=341454 RepID=A0A4S2MVQ0_9PEZI|nr:hypothetical protein EX30DRAFT_349426 [Ascodesmis nigricans]
MSFGFGVGDFIAVGKLALVVYQELVVISRGAPEEFKLLMNELTTLHMMMDMFESVPTRPESYLHDSGRTRQEVVKNSLDQVSKILKDLDVALGGTELGQYVSKEISARLGSVQMEDGGCKC